MNAFVPTPQGPVVALTPPSVQDYPRLVYTAPYFIPVAMADLFEPAVLEAVEAVLPSLIQPYIDPAAQAAVNQYAVLLTGSVMTGPLILMPGMPSSPQQAANKAYVDAMLSTAGIPEVPPVPIGQAWARETGQWVPVDTSGGGDSLPLTGGTMAGPINMSGNQIRGLPTVPTQPDGAASSGWVLQQLAAVSLYQGTWNPATNVPDLTQPVSHQNAYTWIANPVASGGVVVTAAIPGLQGVTVYDGDTIIFSAQSGTFTAIHAGGLSITEADARYLQLTGGQMEGALLLNAAPTQPMQAANMAWVQSLLTGAGIPEAPIDGQSYLRTGSSASWTPGVPLAGGIMTGPLMLSGNAPPTSPLQAVPFQQVMAATGGASGVQNQNTFWCGPSSGPGAPGWRNLTQADFTASSIIIPVNRGGTGQTNFLNGMLVSTGNVISSQPLPLSVANGGTGLATLANGFLTANAGVVSSLPSPLPVANGGTGLANYSGPGLLQVTGAPAAPVMSVTPNSGGVMPLTDESGSNYGTLGTTYWYRVGFLVWIALSGAYPNTSGDTTSAILGPLPYHPVVSIPNLLRCNIANMGVLGVANNSVVTLFNTGTAQAPMQNGGMSNVSFQAFFVYQTNDAP